MARMSIRKFDRADERRPFAGHGHMDLIRFAGTAIGRGEFEPGWRWSKDVGPIAGTRSCMTEHVGVVLSGRMHVVMDDGEEAEMGPGDALHIPPGHDAWVVGDETAVLLDFTGAAQYAVPSAGVAGKQPGAETQPLQH